QLETAFAIRGLSARGYEDDRNARKLGIVLDRLAQMESVDPRHAHVEHDCAGAIDVERGEEPQPVGRHGDLESLHLQQVAQHLASVPIVIHDDDGRCHAALPGLPSGAYIPRLDARAITNARKSPRVRMPTSRPSRSTGRAPTPRWIIMTPAVMAAVSSDVTIGAGCATWSIVRARCIGRLAELAWSRSRSDSIPRSRSPSVTGRWQRSPCRIRRSAASMGRPMPMVIGRDVMRWATVGAAPCSSASSRMRSTAIRTKSVEVTTPISNWPSTTGRQVKW